MKFAIFVLILLVSIAATCALYGWLESSVNMIEGLRKLFESGAGAVIVIFSPLLLLFVVVGLAGLWESRGSQSRRRHSSTNVLASEELRGYG
jgi:hypothetical protein